MNRAEYLAGLNEAIAKGEGPQFREMHGPTHAAHAAKPPEHHAMGGPPPVIVHAPEPKHEHEHDSEHHAKKGK